MSEHTQREPVWHHHGNASPNVIEAGAAKLARGESAVYGDGQGNVYRISPNGETRLVRAKDQGQKAV